MHEDLIGRLKFALEKQKAGAFSYLFWEAIDALSAQPDAGSGGDARAQFEAWYVENTFDYVANPIGSRECYLMWKAWQAAIATHQPVGVEPSGWEIYNEVGKYVTFVKTVALRDAHLHRGEGDLLPQWEARPVYTARQPVGEPVDVNPLAAYAESYRMMARIGDGRVDCLSVAADIENNMFRHTTHPQPAAAKTGHFTPDEMLEATAVLRAKQAKPEVQP